MTFFLFGRYLHLYELYLIPKKWVSSLTDCFVKSVLCKHSHPCAPLSLPKGLSHRKGIFSRDHLLSTIFKTKKRAANELKMRKNAQRMRKRKNAEKLAVSHLCFSTAPPKKNCAKNIHAHLQAGATPALILSAGTFA